ncbi:MAG TPA: PAS domain S-box protein, partial [Candidatus Aquilonibacter sp.]
MLDERDLRLLDDLLSRSPLAIVAWDEQGRIAFWSARAADAFGVGSASVVGKRAADLAFVEPADRDGLQIMLDRVAALEEHGSFAHVCRIARADGVARTYRWTTFAIRSLGAYRALSYAEDLTETLDAQDALVESEERFRSLFEYNPDIVMIFGPSGHVLDVNRAITRIGAATREQIIGMHFSDFLDEEDVPRHREFLERALAGETLLYRARVRSLAGREMDVSITTVPVYREGKIEAAYSIIRDETDQRLALARIREQEHDLSDSEARLRSLFEHNPDGVVAISREGIILDINEASLRIGQYPREAVVGLHYSGLILEHERERVAAAFARALAGVTASTAVEGRHADGAVLELHATLIPQYARGEHIGVYAIMQDVTERRAAERRAEMQSLRIRNLYFIAASGDYPDVRMRAS